MLAEALLDVGESVAVRRMNCRVWYTMKPRSMCQQNTQRIVLTRRSTARQASGNHSQRLAALQASQAPICIIVCTIGKWCLPMAEREK